MTWHGRVVCHVKSAAWPGQHSFRLIVCAVMSASVLSGTFPLGNRGNRLLLLVLLLLLLLFTPKVTGEDLALKVVATQDTKCNNGYFVSVINTPF